MGQIPFHSAIDNQGPFDLVFSCYYAFPTEYPEDIRKIFGREFFKQGIAPEAAREFKQTLRETGVDAVVAFNKGIFYRVSNDKVDCYIERLLEGEMIKSQIKGTECCILTS